MLKLNTQNRLRKDLCAVCEELKKKQTKPRIEDTFMDGLAVALLVCFFASPRTYLSEEPRRESGVNHSNHPQYLHFTGGERYRKPAQNFRANGRRMSVGTALRLRILLMTLFGCAARSKSDILLPNSVQSAFGS